MSLYLDAKCFAALFRGGDETVQALLVVGAQSRHGTSLNYSP
jgi:hypothetical protein